MELAHDGIICKFPSHLLAPSVALEFWWGDDLDGLIAPFRINDPNHSSCFHFDNMLEIPTHQIINGMDDCHSNVHGVIHIFLRDNTAQDTPPVWSSA